MRVALQRCRNILCVLFPVGVLAFLGFQGHQRSLDATPAPDSSGVRLPADFQRGVNHAHIHRRGQGYGSEISAKELAVLRDLGVNWIALNTFAYQHGATASELVGYSGREGNTDSFSRTDLSMTDDDLRAEIAHAHALGMRVVLKPHIWSRDFHDGNEWHGTIRQESPEDHATWWASYRQYILHGAGLAASSKVDLYCIGTELVTMTTAHPGEWAALIAEVRQVYKGPLTYAAHSEKEFDSIAFWDALDCIGVTAYFPLDAPVGASVDQLVASWQPHRQRIAKLQRTINKPVLFIEAGYRPVSDTHQKPWLYSGGQRDDAAQVRAYEALFLAFHNDSWWKGVYFWKTFTDPARASARSDGTDFIFRGRPAEKVVERWFGSASMTTAAATASAPAVRP